MSDGRTFRTGSIEVKSGPGSEGTIIVNGQGGILITGGSSGNTPHLEYIAPTLVHNPTILATGTLTKSSGSFKIDHPLNPKRYTPFGTLIYRRAQADLIYRGKATLSSGTTINIDISGMTDGTFVALNTDVQCFTSNESGWTAIKGSVSGNTLTITAQDNSAQTQYLGWLLVEDMTHT